MASAATIGLAEAMRRLDAQALSPDEHYVTLDGQPYVRCHACRYDVHPNDMGWLFTTICGTCESVRFEQLIVDLVNARGRNARKRALKALKRLRRL